MVLPQLLLPHQSNTFRILTLWCGPITLTPTTPEEDIQDSYTMVWSYHLLLPQQSKRPSGFLHSGVVGGYVRVSQNFYMSPVLFTNSYFDSNVPQTNEILTALILIIKIIRAQIFRRRTLRRETVHREKKC